MLQTTAVSPVMVGRDAEVGRLREALATAQRGDPATVVVFGESGVGKSRVLQAFTDEARDKARILLGGCVDLGATELPFAPFTAALRGLVGELGAANVAELLPPGGAEALATLMPAIATASPLPATDESRSRMFEYLLILLSRLAEQRPCVLVIEDAHWADRSSRDLLDFLVRGQQSLPGLMIVLTHRTGELPRTHPLRYQLGELSRLPWVDRIELDPLSRRHVAVQARAILDREPDPELVTTVFVRSEGNPLFVEALLGCHLDGTDCAVPPTLEDVLLEPMLRLPEPARHIVGVAAVAGAQVDHELLTAVAKAGGADDTLATALRTAVDAGVLVAGADGYAFRHALIRDAVYQALLPGERTELHRQYADAMAADSTGSGAHHLFAAGDVRRAIPAAWQAAIDARRNYAYAEELDLLERILDLWHTVEDAAELAGTDHRSVLGAAVEAAIRAGEHARGEELASQVLAELDGQDEQVRTALMLERRGVLRAALGEPTYVDDRRDAVRLIPADHPARAYLLNSLASALLQVPAPDEAKRVAGEAMLAASEHGDPASEASAMITLAILESRVGDLDAQLPRFAKARAIAGAVGAHQVALRAWHAEAHLLNAYGRFSEAAAMAREGLTAAKDAGLARAHGPAHVIDLALALIDAGAPDDAVEAIGYGLSLVPAPNHHAHLLCLKGFVALQRGEVELPRRAVTRARELRAGTAALSEDPLLITRLDVEVHLEAGTAADAIPAVDKAVTQEHLLPATRFMWPLLVLGARIAAAAGEPGAALLPTLRDVAGKLTAPNPVQRAWAAMFRAEVSRTDVDAWRAAVSVWEPLGQPLRLAQARYGLAEAILAAGGDRGEARDALRRAAEIAEDLGAAPLQSRIASLARRARIALNGASPERPPVSHGLTARELEILRLVSDGRSNAEIAGELFIAPKTASVHVSNILGKLGVANRVEAAAAAHREGLLEPVG